jgi:hypothetical protein
MDYHGLRVTAVHNQIWGQALHPLFGYNTVIDSISY